MNVLTKTLRIAAALLLGITSGCSRKAEQVAPATPEVLATTVMPKDVPVVKRRGRDARRVHQREHQCAGAGLHYLAQLQGRQRG